MTAAYSTGEVARAIKVSKITLLRWLWAGRIPEPKRQAFGGVENRVWSEADLNRAKLYRQEHYRKRS
jgi:DNA-binding transcriptional MerR regulator